MANQGHRVIDGQRTAVDRLSGHFSRLTDNLGQRPRDPGEITERYFKCRDHKGPGLLPAVAPAAPVTNSLADGDLRFDQPGWPPGACRTAGRRDQGRALHHFQPVFSKGSRIAAMVTEEDRVEPFTAKGRPTGWAIE